MLTRLQNSLRTVYAKIRIEVFNSDLVLGRDLFEDKRVIIVGPAESSLTYMKGPDTDKFDMVVRINSSPIQLNRFSERIGGRTDVQNWIANSIHNPQKERLVFKQMQHFSYGV